MNEPSWFHVFDADNSLWLQEDGREWGPYRGAAEYESYENASNDARRQIKSKGPDYDGTVIVLADHGTVE